MRSDDKTEMGGVQEAFLTTHWSLIDDVGASDNVEKKNALVELLLKCYWKPVYCYLRRKGYNNEQAKDLTQGFFHEVVLGRQLIEKADRSKGRFRSYLLVALNHYLSAAHAAQTARKRMPEGGLVPLDMANPPDFNRITEKYTPEESFDYAWVSALLEQVLEDIETTFYQEGKGVHWHVFHERVLMPIMEEIDPPALADICRKYGIENPRVASNMIVTVKRRFQSVLREHLRRTVISDGRVEEEWAEISRFLPHLAQDQK